MFSQDYEALCAGAEGKLAFLRRSPVGYFLASMLAGIYVAFGGFVSVTVGGLLSSAGSEWAKILSAFSFSSALSLVIMAGSELFTGNNLTLSAAVFARRAKAREALWLWLVCWLGNLAGAWLAVLLYKATGLLTGATAAYFASSSVAKVSLSIPQMLSRGVLCNICVCLAVWCGIRMKSESGKLIMVFWCIFVFMLCGFEHSVANMSIIGAALLEGAVDLWSYALDLAVVTVGNVIGGALFVALPYYIVSRRS